MNLFYCNGIISLIVSSALVKKEFIKKKNILIIEQERTKIIPSNFKDYNEEYYKIVKIIAKCSNWHKIKIIKVKNFFISFENLFWPLNKLPIKSLRFLIGRVNTQKKLKKFLKKLSNIDKLIVSDNSLFWRNIYTNNLDISYVEHGAASYRIGTISKNWKFFLKKFYFKLTSIDLNLRPNYIYLSDNKMSLKVRNFKNKQIGITPKSLNLAKYIKEIFKNFLRIYKNEYLEEFQELLNIKKKYKKIYIYLPTSIVPSYDYQNYLRNQLDTLDLKDKESIFLIKKHGNDRSKNYANYFKFLNLKTLTFKKNLNNYIPVEILLFFLDNSIAIGSYSSAHLYSNWWLNKKSIFSEVKNSSIQNLLTTEYKSVYEDFKLLNNKSLN